MKCSTTYLPVPPFGAHLGRGSGRISLQYELLQKSFAPIPLNEDRELLAQFYDRLINLEQKTAKRSRRLIDPNRILKQVESYPPVKAIPSVACTDDGANLRFEDHLLRVFEKFRDPLLIKIEQDARKKLNVKWFERQFPQLKAQIQAVAQDKKAPICTDVMWDWSWGEFFGFAADEVRTAKGGHIFTDPWKMFCDEPKTSGTSYRDKHKVQRHYVQKLATVLDKFEHQKQADIANFGASMDRLKHLTDPAQLTTPYWVPNTNTCYYRLLEPHYEHPQTEEQREKYLAKYPVTGYIPVGLAIEGVGEPERPVEWHPARGWANEQRFSDPLSELRKAPLEDGQCTPVVQWWKAIATKNPRASAEDQRLLDFLQAT